jgi:methyltransferase (TIGR00027 family)
MIQDLTPSPIRHVSDTALWVAMYRAFESERPDALFRDPHARRLAGERGAAIVRAMPRGRAMAWPMVVRTAVMDEIILRCVGEGATTVINLAAGLDTRAFRLPLPPSLRWFDVDLPDMIAYRREHLAGVTPVCAYEALAADLADAEARGVVLARAREEPGTALVITEGLLVYLTAPRVTALAEQIHREPEARWWLTDLATPLLLQMLSRSWQPHLAAANAPMQFAPAEGTAFFAPLGWREAEFRSVWEESLRLGRSVRLARLWDWLGRLRSKAVRDAYRRMSAIVLLERA